MNDGQLIATTTRLNIREFTVGDLAVYHRLMSEPEIIRYTGAPVGDMTIDDSADFLKTMLLPHYREFGYGRWACERRHERDVIGWAGYRYLPEFDAVDLGYRFLLEHWGMGYATEAAEAVLERGATLIGLENVLAAVDPANTASIRVLEKIGLRFSHEGDYYGSHALFYVH